MQIKINLGDKMCNTKIKDDKVESSQTKIKELIGKYEHHNEVAKGVMAMISNWDADTLKFVRTILPQTDKASINKLLESATLKKHPVELPNGLKLTVDVDALRSTPILEDAINMEAMAKLNNSGSDAIIARKKDATVTDSLYKLSLLFSVLATECLLFTPIQSEEQGQLFETPVQSASGLNLELLETISTLMFDNSMFEEPVDLTGAIKIQCVTSTDLQEAINNFAPKSGLNQSIALTENNSKKDMRVYLVNNHNLKEVISSLKELLELTDIMLCNDYTKNQIQVYSKIMDNLKDDSDTYILIKPVNITLPLKLEIGVTEIKHLFGYKHLVQGISEEYLQEAEKDLVVTIYSDGKTEDGKPCTIPYEVAVSYMEKIQGYEAGYIDAMISKAKQMYAAKQAVDSISSEVQSQLYARGVIIQKIETISTGKIVEAEDRYKFAIKLVHKEDSSDLDITAMKKIKNLLMENPYKTKVVF